MKWVLLIGLALGFDFASDVYFRTLHHVTDGVSPKSWDSMTTILVVVGVVGLIFDAVLEWNVVEIARD